MPDSPVQYGEPLTNANARAGFNFIPNGVEEKNIYYYHPDHLGSSSYITDKNGEVIQHTEYIAFGEVLVDEHSTTNKMPYLFNGKELDYETGLYYYGARYYDPKVSIFLNVDPLVEKTGTPYAYTYNNPIRFIDPTGMEAERVVDDPIYDKKGNKVGDDGKNDNKAYIVTGKILKEVKKATKEGKNYNEPLKEGNQVMILPTNDVANDIIKSYEDTVSSKLEHGGHSYIGENNAVRWDAGTGAEVVRDEEGETIGARASISPFKINGAQQIPSNASNIQYWWHVHPDITVGGISLGASKPSKSDYLFQGQMKSKGFIGNTFVIGARTKTVTFYNNQKTILTIKYDTFKKIMGK